MTNGYVLRIIETAKKLQPTKEKCHFVSAKPELFTCCRLDQMCKKTPAYDFCLDWFFDTSNSTERFKVGQLFNIEALVLRTIEVLHKCYMCAYQWKYVRI